MFHLKYVAVFVAVIACSCSCSSASPTGYEYKTLGEEETPKKIEIASCSSSQLLDTFLCKELTETEDCTELTLPAGVSLDISVGDKLSITLDGLVEPFSAKTGCKDAAISLWTFLPKDSNIIATTKDKTMVGSSFAPKKGLFAYVGCFGTFAQDKGYACEGKWEADKDCKKIKLTDAMKGIVIVETINTTAYKGSFFVVPDVESSKAFYWTCTSYTKWFAGVEAITPDSGSYMLTTSPFTVLSAFVALLAIYIAQ